MWNSYYISTDKSLNFSTLHESQNPENKAIAAVKMAEPFLHLEIVPHRNEQFRKTKTMIEKTKREIKILKCVARFFC
jgi:hypothetical protein